MTAASTAPITSAAPAAELRSASWYRGATRWTQVTFVEDDPLHVDLDQWIDIMRRSHSNALCVSAGGYIAYYPTKVPLHHRSVHLGNRDLFGEFVEAARGLGMHVMARIDPHAVHADAARAHPEWLARDEQGAAIEHPSFPGIYLTCPFSSYNREVITEIATEIVRDYDVDAIFANRWQGTGVSYSTSARDGFRAATGHEIPDPTLESDAPAWHEYRAWRRRELSGLVGLWDDAVREVRPHARFLPNLGSFAAHELDPALVRRHYPMLLIDKQSRSGLEPLWGAGRNGKRSRATFRDRPVGLITSVGPETGHRWKDSVNAGPETAMWIVDGFAHGAFPWFTKFNGVLSDDRWVEPVAAAFATHAQVESAYARTEPSAQVALVETVPSTRAGEDRAAANRDGAYQALVDSRIPFEMVSASQLTLQELDRFRVVLLCDVDDLDAGSRQALRAYAADGGSLVVTHRGAHGLEDVLGLESAEPERGPLRNTMAALSDRGPLVSGFGGATRIIAGVHTIAVRIRDDVGVPLRFFPDYPDLPMEEVYPRRAPAEPAVTTWERPDGGRSVYIAFDLTELYWSALQDDHRRLLANAIEWALDEEPAVRVEGAGMVDVAVRSGPHDLVVSLVNLTNPMTMRGQMREILPSPPQVVDLAAPVGVRDPQARLLIAGTEAEIERTSGRSGPRWRLRVPSIDLLESVHLTWKEPDDE